MLTTRTLDVSTTDEDGWFHLPRLILLTAIAIAGFLMLRSIAQPWVGLDGGDGALFSSMARNYIQFGVSTLNWGQLTTFEEISQPIGSHYLHHPPLFPLLVAGSFSIFGETEFATRLVSVLATLLTAVLLFLIVKKAISPRGGLLATFFFLTYPSTVVFGRKPGYEALSLFLIVLAVFLYQQYRSHPAPLRRYLLFAAIALAAASDWPAFFLPPALVLHSIFYRKYQELDLHLLSGLLLAPSLILAAFLWSAYSVDKAAIIDLLHQGMAYAGLVSPSDTIAQHVIEARKTFTNKEYILRLIRNVNLNFGMIPFLLAPFGFVALKSAKEFRGIVVVLLAAALGDCFLFWRSLYFHIWWQHLLTAPLAIFSAVAVNTLLTTIPVDSAATRLSNLRTAFLAALVLPVLLTLIYNVWQLSQEQTRVLPTTQMEPANLLRLLGKEINIRTRMGDHIVTNMATPEASGDPYDRILPYYARRVLKSGLLNQQQVVEYLNSTGSKAGNVFFLFWEEKPNSDGGALSAWLNANAIPSVINVAGQRFDLFKLGNLSHLSQHEDGSK